MNENTTLTDTPEAKPQAPAAESSASPAPAAVEAGGNQSVDSLAAELSRSRRARRAPDSAKPTGETKPDEQVPAESDESPESPNADATDETNATSTPVEEEVDDDEKGDDEESDKPKAVRELQGRVHKQTAVIKSQKETIAQLEAQVEELKRAPQRQVHSGQPFAGHAELSDIDTEAEELQAHLDWLDEHPDGGRYERDGKVIHEDVPADKVTRLQRNIERRMAQLSALRATKVDGLRAKHAEDMRQGWSEATRTHPWLADAKSREHAEAVKIVQGLPPQVREVLDAFPEGRMFLGDVVAARMARSAKPAGGQPTPRPAPPKLLGKASSAQPKRDPQAGLQQQLADAEVAFQKSGSTNDLKRVESIKRQLRMAR